ncbi:hypothetical protein PRIPAC_70526 [Pristionchus pacificus]|uniref:Uncharacterized protein n=1 Tax=Pristionchus pacificus TaxID=54126 RepID=A0A2A6C7A3_PRIPA|nr:hypothetical protein PRIPAC_70526 [Pristionchus pacificus]|eukprot:PDM73948.1 hypothetical protein PRIPAC_41304 [Pristionchus pacificus]
MHCRVFHGCTNSTTEIGAISESHIAIEYDAIVVEHVKWGHVCAAGGSLDHPVCKWRREARKSLDTMSSLAYQICLCGTEKNVTYPLGTCKAYADLKNKQDVELYRTTLDGEGNVLNTIQSLREIIDKFDEMDEEANAQALEDSNKKGTIEAECNKTDELQPGKEFGEKFTRAFIKFQANLVSINRNMELSWDINEDAEKLNNCRKGRGEKCEGPDNVFVLESEKIQVQKDYVACIEAERINANIRHLSELAETALASEKIRSNSAALTVLNTNMRNRKVTD